MFSSGMKESKEEKIVLDHINYDVFFNLCQYLYTGDVFFGINNERELDLDYLIQMFTASDEFILDEIKVECEKKLAKLLNINNF